MFLRLLFDVDSWGRLFLQMPLHMIPQWSKLFEGSRGRGERELDEWRSPNPRLVALKLHYKAGHDRRGMVHGQEVGNSNINSWRLTLKKVNSYFNIHQWARCSLSNNLLAIIWPIPTLSLWISMPSFLYRRLVKYILIGSGLPASHPKAFTVSQYNTIVDNTFWECKTGISDLEIFFVYKHWIAAVKYYSWNIFR